VLLSSLFCSASCLVYYATSRCCKLWAHIPRYRIKADVIAAVWGKDGQAISRGLGIFENQYHQLIRILQLLVLRPYVQHSNVLHSILRTLVLSMSGVNHTRMPSNQLELLWRSNRCNTRPHGCWLWVCLQSRTAAIQTCLGFVYQVWLTMGSLLEQILRKRLLGMHWIFCIRWWSCIHYRKNQCHCYDKPYPFLHDRYPDFWRRAEMKYPSHGGRFTGEPAYFKHITTVQQTLWVKQGQNHRITHMRFSSANGKFPVNVAKKLGLLWIK